MPSSATPNDSSVPASSGGTAGSSSGEEIAVTEEELVDGEPSGDRSADERRVMMTGSFSGPLPPPNVLARYDEVRPGLAGEIVEQWKAETRHRHATIDHLRNIDREAMLRYYEGERRGQYIALTVFIGSVGVAALSIVLKVAPVGIAAIIAAGGSAIWSMRRRSNAPGHPVDLSEGDAIEHGDST